MCSSMANFLWPPGDARCPHASIPCAGLATPQGTCTATSYTLVEIRTKDTQRTITLAGDYVVAMHCTHKSSQMLSLYKELSN